MKIERRFTKTGESPYQNIPFSARSSEIKNPDGSAVFHQDNIQAPEHWSQLAIDILAQKNIFVKQACLNMTTKASPFSTKRVGLFLVVSVMLDKFSTD